jgi:hypothetical protein
MAWCRARLRRIVAGSSDQWRRVATVARNLCLEEAVVSLLDKHAPNWRRPDMHIGPIFPHRPFGGVKSASSPAPACSP